MAPCSLPPQPRFVLAHREEVSPSSTTPLAHQSHCCGPQDMAPGATQGVAVGCSARKLPLTSLVLTPMNTVTVRSLGPGCRSRPC